MFRVSSTLFIRIHARFCKTQESHCLIQETGMFAVLRAERQRD